MASDSTTSRVLPLLCAITGGVLLVMALQVVLTAYGLQISDIWRDAIAGNPVGLKAAGVWWMMALLALIVGAAIAWLLRQYPAPWRRQRPLRWILGAAILFGLAHVGHGVGVPDGIGPVVYLLATTAAMIIAALMGAIGAIFALRA
jgi:hypothetical protein